jgi:hypothetical protein
VTVLAPSRGRVSSAMPSAPWDWAAQPVAGPNVTLLADFTSLATINAQGGFLATPSNTAQNPADFSFGPGKYGPAILPLGTNQGNFVQYPLDGLGRGDEFTIAFWAMHPTLAWDAVSGRLVTLSGVNFTIPIGLGTGTFSGAISLLPNAPAGVPGKATINLSQSASGLGLVAGAWHHVAVTMAAGTLRLNVNGALVKSLTGVTVPNHLTDTNAISAGLTVGGSTSGPAGMWISDLVVYRAARTPGQSNTRRSPDGHATFDTTARTAITPGVVGALHPPWYTGMDAGIVSAAVKMIRTDKLVNATPMKAGGTDATHPTLGQSGLYSYDWQVVDRTLNEIVRLGAKPYVSVDSTPQILGAGQPPLSGPT